MFVRASAALKEQLKTEAKQNGRTLNAEIVQRLKVSLLEGYRKL